MATLKDVSTADSAKSKDYKIINIDIQYKGKRVNLGGLFVNDKSSKVAQIVFKAIEDGTITPDKLKVFVKDTYDSSTQTTEEVTASDFE